MQTSVSMDDQFIGNWHIKHLKTWNTWGVSRESQTYGMFRENKGWGIKANYVQMSYWTTFYVTLINWDLNVEKI